MPDAQSDPRRATVMETIGKLCVAVVVFVTIVSGAFLYQRSRSQGQIVLPDQAQYSRCSIWFVGSSTIYRWRTLARDMQPWDAHNRGINGATITELTTALSNETSTQRPAAIILYAGENDIAHGSTSDETVAALKNFLTVKARHVPDVPMIVVGLKPSPGRWANRPAQIAFNQAVQTIAAGDTTMAFIDSGPALLVQGRPGPFYVADGIHLNAAGYARLTATIRPALDRLQIHHCNPVR